MNLKEVKAKLQELEIKPSKKLGQNFLVNEGMALKITKAVRQTPSPYVEIGSGLGALTKFFHPKKDPIFLIEKDKKLASYWKQKGFVVFCADALKFDWSKIPSPFVLFGNLPYQIAGSLVLEMSLLSEPPSQMVLMMQKEVAQRVLAKPHTKDYGLLSVMSQTFWSTQFLFSAGKANFYPIPEVSGWLLKFAPRSQSVSPHFFLQFIKKAFTHRRKRLIKQLPTNLSKAWEKFFLKQNWDLNLRAENLSPSDFLALYHKWERLKKKQIK